MRCDKCKFWELHYNEKKQEFHDPDEDTWTGFCKRFPPQYVGIYEYDFEKPSCYLWAYPETLANSLCGEFAPNAGA